MSFQTFGEARGIIRKKSDHVRSDSSCSRTLGRFSEEIVDLNRKMRAQSTQAGDSVIAIVNADDIHGRMMADAISPHSEWQAIRDMHLVPFALGVVRREHMQEFIGIFDAEAMGKLRKTPRAAVVIDFDTVEIFTV